MSSHQVQTFHPRRPMTQRSPVRGRRQEGAASSTLGVVPSLPPSLPADGDRRHLHLARTRPSRPDRCSGSSSQFGGCLPRRRRPRALPLSPPIRVWRSRASPALMAWTGDSCPCRPCKSPVLRGGHAGRGSRPAQYRGPTRFAIPARAPARGSVELGEPVRILGFPRGSQFRSNAFVRTIKNNGLVSSMGRLGADNAAMESFFALLQNTVLDRQRWSTREELWLAIITWIERTYHRRRRQRRLGRLTPIEYETLKPAATAA
jgi:hypothetical protein